MTDIFISYSQQDRPIAENLAKRLGALGFRIWWDLELYAGEDFHDAILNALKAAKAVIVIWSDTAARSPWVRDEARRAMEQSKLIATHLPQFDLANLPMPFGTLHTSRVDDLPTILRALNKFGVQSANKHAVGEEKPGSTSQPEQAPQTSEPSSKPPAPWRQGLRQHGWGQIKPKPINVTPQEHQDLADWAKQQAQNEQDPAKRQELNRLAQLNEFFAKQNRDAQAQNPNEQAIAAPGAPGTNVGSPSSPPLEERSPSPVAAANEPKAQHNIIRTLGIDPDTGKQVTLRTGRFGSYLQLGEPEGGLRAKTCMLRGVDIETLDLLAALHLFRLQYRPGAICACNSIIIPAAQANPREIAKRSLRRLPVRREMGAAIGWGLSARQAHNLNVVGSNPTPATNLFNTLSVFL